MNATRPSSAEKSGEIVIAMPDRERLMTLTVALGHMPLEVTAIQTHEALDAARAYTGHNVGAMIIALDGRETTVDLRALLASRPECTFVLLVADMPPAAAVARVAHAAGAALLSIDEAPIVVAATLIAMLGRESAVR
jgi:hypothetical protein